jgi:hypothetical protein
MPRPGPGEVKTVEEDPPRRGRIDAAYAVEGTRLPGPVGTYKGEEFAPEDVERDIVKNRESSHEEAYVVQT